MARHTATFEESLCDHKFDPYGYVSSLLAGGDVKPRLQKTRQAADRLRDLGISGLREDAFQYHTQIVRAAQELKIMEKSLSELRGLLLDEKGTLDFIGLEPVPPESEKTLTPNEGARSRFVTRKSLSGLFNKIDGFDNSKLIERERYLVGSKDIKQCHPATLEPIYNHIAHLFSDCMVFTLWTPHRENDFVYQYTFVEVIYFDSINGIEVFNVQAQKKHHKFFERSHGASQKPAGEHPQLRYPFLVSFSNDDPTRLFDCDSPKQREEWLRYLREYTKAVQEIKPKGRHGSQAPEEVSLNHVISEADSLDKIVARYRSMYNMNQENNDDIPQWYREAGTEIQDRTDMHEYDEAIAMLCRAQEFWRKKPHWTTSKEALLFHRKCQAAEERLIEHLLETFRSAMDCPFGFDRPTCTKLLDYFSRTGRLFEAVTVYLDHRTRLLNITLESVKPEETTTAYIRSKSEALVAEFVKTIQETEDLGLASASRNRSAMLGWIRFNLTRFCEEHKHFIFCRHLSFPTVTEILDHLLTTVQHCADQGFDVRIQLEACLEEHIHRWFDSHIEALFDDFNKSVKGNAPCYVSFGSNEAAAPFIERCVTEEVGDLTSFLENGKLNIASEVIDYAKRYIQLVKAVCTVCHAGMRRAAEAWLSAGITPLGKYLQSQVTAETQDHCNIEQLRNAVLFLSTRLFPDSERRFRLKFPGNDYLFFMEKEALSELLDLIKEKTTTEFYKRTEKPT